MNIPFNRYRLLFFIVGMLVVFFIVGAIHRGLYAFR